MSRAHGGSFDARNRRVLAADQAAIDALGDTIDTNAATAADATAALDVRVTALEDAPAPTGTLVRTVITLTAAQVALLGATPTGDVVLTPDLPAFSHIVNGTFRIVTPFVSTTPLYNLDAVFFWRAADSNPVYDAVPYPSTPKTGYIIGTDTGTLVDYNSLGSAFINDSAFGANANPWRWPYTPTPVVTLTSGGGGAPNLDTYTDGELEIIIFSVTML